MRGVVVEGVAAFGVAVEGLEFLALEPFVEGLVVAFDGFEAPAEVGASAALMAIPAPRVVAMPTLAQPTKRRLCEAGWGRVRRAMGGTVRI